MNQSELVTKIIRDTGNRTDITADVSAAISSAVTFYQRERFWFLETATSIVTTSSIGLYTSPADLGPKIDTMMIKLSGGSDPIVRDSSIEMEEYDDGRTFGEPTNWAFTRNQIRLYPVPDNSYTLNLTYHCTLDAPTSTASNAWTQAGAELIRYRAKWDIQAHILKDEQNAQVTKDSELQEFNSLMSESTRRMATGRVRKWGW